MYFVCRRLSDCSHCATIALRLEASVGVAAIQVAQELRGQHDAVALGSMPADVVSDDLLGMPFGIGIGRIDEVAAELEEGLRAGAPPQSSPKVIAPRQRGETRRPELPSDVAVEGHGEILRWARKPGLDAADGGTLG